MALIDEWPGKLSCIELGTQPVNSDQQPLTGERLIPPPWR
jgi:hypothetical protein